MEDLIYTVFKCPIPRCGGELVVRENKETGKKFLGCSNFPQCRHTEEYIKEEENLPDAASRWE